ncbi:M48 family metalloprotease [Bacillus sp. NPDC077027]|uniref:M48 family metalloprotease n=1 Tax=Bacillus sp. NPDC077027 TaxID=3390548 RepID=UPI003D093A83
MEVRKCKFNYAYIIWSMITIIIAILILSKVMSLPIMKATLLIFMLFGIIFLLNYGLVGDWRNRIRLGLRRPATLEERKYLEQINDEVFQRVRSQYLHLKKADLFLINEEYVNAYALGFRTIGLTIGAVRNLSNEEIKAVIAHEYAHLANKDTLQLILFNTSFTILSIVLWPIYIIAIGLGIIFAFLEGMVGQSKGSISVSLMNAFITILNWTHQSYCRIGIYFVNFGSRDFEYRADEVAAKAGYGKGLLSFFYKLEKTDNDIRKGFLTLLASTHPYTSYRIENIEKFLDVTEINHRTIHPS